MLFYEIAELFCNSQDMQVRANEEEIEDVVPEESMQWLLLMLP